MGVESFKNFQRGARVQLSEDTYAKGMQFTNAPLTTGLCKMLINYDLKDNGKVLTPRAGLTGYEILKYPEVPATLYTDTMNLLSSKECTEDDNKTYQQIIIGDAGGKLYAVTNELGAVASAKINELTSTARFSIPTEAEIHSIPLTDLKHMPRHIGTFAFNNSYYFFDDAGLKHTKLVDGKYASEAVTPRELTPSEAVMWGYNMLKDNPYLFSNTILALDSPIYLDGVLPYDADSKLALSPQVNQKLHFECFFRAFTGKQYTVVWEWKEAGAGAWTTLKTETVTIAANSRLLCDFNVPNSSVLLKITATNKVDAIDMQVMTIGFDFGKTTQGNAANSKQTNYDLKQSSSMCFWRNRLAVAYHNLLFISEVNDPSYFPYPNNMEPFSESIIYILPYLDDLLVFTTSKLYSIRLGVDGLSWTVNNIQGNLNIKEDDIHLIQVVKNMVFFKSGNYYYMVVPKASVTTKELTIAPISRPVEPLFDTFKSTIDKAIKTIYDYSDGMELLYYYNFLDFEDVHNVYVFKTKNGILLNVDVLYNTVLRVWRLYTFESWDIVKPYRQDATTKGVFMMFTPMGTAPCIQLFKFDPSTCMDSWAYPDEAEHELVFKNYQMLDTGSRDIASDLKKRFREAQLRLNNRSNKTLYFYSEFYIDGDTRKALYKYTPHQEIDPASPDYGLLTMERELIDPVLLPGTTILAETQEDYNYWSLDISQFPDTSLWKIRIPFSGKGYCPQMVLVSHNLEPYELLHNIWVFRQLYSR